MKEARDSDIKELRSFVAGIERDYDAVSAGLSLVWRKACRRRNDQQTENAQEDDVWTGQFPPASAETPPSYVRTLRFLWVSPKSYMSQV